MSYVLTRLELLYKYHDSLRQQKSCNSMDQTLRKLATILPYLLPLHLWLFSTRNGCILYVLYNFNYWVAGNHLANVRSLINGLNQGTGKPMHTNAAKPEYHGLVFTHSRALIYIYAMRSYSSLLPLHLQSPHSLSGPSRCHHPPHLHASLLTLSSNSQFLTPHCPGDLIQLFDPLTHHLVGLLPGQLNCLFFKAQIAGLNFF